MFIDLATLDSDERQRLAAKLPGPHTWVWFMDETFYCRDCADVFDWDEPVPEGPCAPIGRRVDARLKAHSEWLGLDDFIGHYGRATADRRRAKAGLRLA